MSLFLSTAPEMKKPFSELKDVEIKHVKNEANKFINTFRSKGYSDDLIRHVASNLATGLSGGGSGSVSRAKSGSIFDEID